MSDIDRLRSTMRNKQAILSGLHDQLRDHQRRLDQVRANRSRAGEHYDALLRQQEADRQISDHQGSIGSMEREIRRVSNEISGLENEIRSRR